MKSESGNKVCVIIPVKNGMPYIKETLASLEAQSFKKFDVLVWDNGSTDGTLELLHQWIPSRIGGRVVSNEPLPYDSSLARLVTEADYEYLVRLDADDIALPLRIEQQIDFLEKNSDIAVVGGQIELIDESGISKGLINFPENNFEILIEFLWKNPIPHPGVTMRRAAVLIHGNYRQLRPVEDLDLWIRIGSRERLHNLPITVIKYRHHPLSVTHLSKKNKTHGDSLSRCIEREVPKYYPISSKKIKALRRKRYIISIIPMLEIAYYISKREKISIIQVITSNSFIYTARCMTSEKDIISRFAYKILDLFKKLNNK